MITNDAGQIALAHHQPAPAYVSGNRTPSGNAYVFAVQRAVSLAWVDPGDVNEILAMKGGCCGGTQRLFAYATPGQVSVWTNGTRGPDTNEGNCGC